MYMLSCVQLCDPLDCRPPSSCVHGIFQARILEQVAISYSKGSLWPRDWTQISCVFCFGRCILYHCALWEALLTFYECFINFKRLCKWELLLFALCTKYIFIATTLWNSKSIIYFCLICWELFILEFFYPTNLEAHVFGPEVGIIKRFQVIWQVQLCLLPGELCWEWFWGHIWEGRGIYASHEFTLPEIYCWKSIF